MREKIIEIFIGLIILLVILATGYGIWMIERDWNYKLSYEDMVRKTVLEMVKEDCLKESKP